MEKSFSILNKLLSPEGVARQALKRRGLNRKVEIFDYLISKGYTFLGEGRHRVCFLSPNKKWVVKLARDGAGEIDNAKELSAWRDVSVRYKLARCRALSPEILVMEYVDSIPYDEMPDWASYIDCQQVGRNRAGKIVAYDYGG